MTFFIHHFLKPFWEYLEQKQHYYKQWTKISVGKKIFTGGFIDLHLFKKKNLTKYYSESHNQNQEQSREDGKPLNEPQVPSFVL